MNKLWILLIFALLASSTLFAIPVIPNTQGQGPTSDLPMTIINETNSSNNTGEDVMITHNMPQVSSR